MSQFLNRVIARTQKPTEINCASEYFTFGNITEVNPTREQWEDLALGEPTTFLMVVKLLSQVSMLDSGSAKNQLNYITGRLLIPICPGLRPQTEFADTKWKKQSLQIFKTIQNILHQGYWCFLLLFCSLGFLYSVEMIKTPSSGNPAFTLGKADAHLRWPYPLTKATAPLIWVVGLLLVHAHTFLALPLSRALAGAPYAPNWRPQP